MEKEYKRIAEEAEEKFNLLQNLNGQLKDRIFFFEKEKENLARENLKFKKILKELSSNQIHKRKRKKGFTGSLDKTTTHHHKKKYIKIHPNIKKKKTSRNSSICMVRERNHSKSGHFHYQKQKKKSKLIILKHTKYSKQ